VFFEILVVAVFILIFYYEETVRRKTEQARRTAVEAEERARQLCQQMVEERARLLFNAWREKYEKQIREDAVKRSTSVVKGRVAEQFVPFLEQFKYNPRDARFIGSPVDYIVFDGLTEDRDITIVLVEVKTGRTTRLNERERRVLEAVKARRIKWETIHLH